MKTDFRDLNVEVAYNVTHTHNVADRRNETLIKYRCSCPIGQFIGNDCFYV